MRRPFVGWVAMPDQETNVVLPFAVIEREGGGGEEFPFEMTLATVLADVEKEREKAGLLRRREESMEFASFLYWPIVVSPWRETRHLVFDGMSVWSYVFPQGLPPDPRAFVQAAQAVKDARELQAFLVQRGAYFDAFAKTENHPIMGLFIHEEFMRDLLAHLSLGRPKQIRGTPMLQPRLSTAHAIESVRRLRGIVESMEKDMREVTAAEGSLAAVVARARNDLATRREEIVRSYNQRIEQVKPEVAAEVTRLEREREGRWTAMAPKLVDLQAAVRKTEADLVSWDTQSRRRDDPSAAAQARTRRDETRLALDRARDDVQRFQADMAQMRAAYDRQVQTQWDRIRLLEREREAEVGQLHQEEQSLAAAAERVATGIRNVIKNLGDAVQFLESQGVPANVPDTTLVYMPIFVASFWSDRGRRMVVYPPMVARSGKGIMGSLKSTFGGAVLPLEPKTQRFEEIFRGGIEKALAEDASLSALVASVGNANNVLHLGNLKSLLSRGLAEMKTQGWIKDKHEREFLERLERHITEAARTAPKSPPPPPSS